jgi:hypothetical protein
VPSLPTNDAFPTHLSPPATTAGQAFDTSPQFFSTTQSQQFPDQSASADASFLQAGQGIGQQSSSPQFGPQGSHLNSNNNNNNSVDFNTLFANGSADHNQAIDPLFLSNTLDPQLLDPQAQNLSLNRSDLMHQMAATQAHSPTPPHLLQSNMHQQSPSPHASPNMAQGAFPSPSHSRHASLDPSAAYAQVQGNEWNGMAAFRGHRRAPSDTYSDVSSAQASPYLGNQDSFDHDNPSPLLHAQQDPALFSDVMSFGQFNLNDNSHISPGHSPHISPRLLPQQQALPQFSPGNFGLGTGMNNQYGDQGMNNQYAEQGMNIYQGQEPFPTINQAGPEFGQADTMSPPEINIDFAPPSRQASFEPAKPGHSSDALSPPDRCMLVGPLCVFHRLTVTQLAAAIVYAPSLTLSAVPVPALLHQVQK